MRAVDQAYQTVRDGIISGRYPPASRITEQEIAEAAGVSRTPIGPTRTPTRSSNCAPCWSRTAPHVPP